MHLALLTVHGWFRWVVLGLGIASLTPRTRDRWWLAFVVALDVQVTLGLVLYGFLSPLGMPVLRDAGAIMHQTVPRFWAIEHPVGMLVALVLAHAARVAARRAPDDDARARRRLWGTAIPLLLILLTIPWPFMPYGRPLFRL